jgi:hypothetical protein
MPRNTVSLLVIASVMIVAPPFVGAEAPTPAAKAAAPDKPAWITKSDGNAKLLLDVSARFTPEFAGFLGVEGVDEQVLDLKPGLYERSQQANRDALAALGQRLAAETDPHVREDLQILIQADKDSIEQADLDHKYLVAYVEVPQMMFQGIRALLDDQVAPDRRAKAVVRLKRYAGLEPGYTPLTVLAERRMQESLTRKDVQGPFKGEIEKHLANSPQYVAGIGKLLEKYQLGGWQEAYAALQQQVSAYDAFLKNDLLPRARTDFRLPPEMYAFALRQYGVDIPPAQLAERARISFMEIQNEMKALAPLVAREKGFTVTNYRDVIRELKKEQLVGDAILPHYQKRMRDLEEIIRREQVITLPARDARIRLASEAESAAIPAPNMRPPRFIGNTGEMGEFVLPLRVPTLDKDGKQTVQGFDDFTFDAASWTLTVHEGRPGHELQFASVIEKGVSLARALFALNSVNVEGWALYTEAEMKPYLPLDGQLISLQHRLMRAARAFLDPELQAGQIEPEAAVAFLMDEVVLSEPMARQEVERYTFFAPGQATSYFYGYTRWMQLKSQAEFTLGKKFDRHRYHDFILSQGLLPPDILGQAVLKEFLPAEQARGAGHD